jgi:hypothetical protein
MPEVEDQTHELKNDNQHLQTFTLNVAYNGVTKPIHVEQNEQVTAVLHKAIAAFGISQNPHLLSLYRQDGTLVPESDSVKQAGLKPGELLLLRPNVVKGGSELLHLSKDTLRQTFLKFIECGRGECECVLYWTGPGADNVVDEIEHPIHGRSRSGYKVDDNWLTGFWRDLATYKRGVKAQIHTHPGKAFHSMIDDQSPIVSQAGFISIVIPNFATGEPSLSEAWIGRLAQNGEWNRTCPKAVLSVA